MKTVTILSHEILNNLNEGQNSFASIFFHIYFPVPILCLFAILKLPVHEYRIVMPVLLSNFQFIQFQKIFFQNAVVQLIPLLD